MLDFTRAARGDRELELDGRLRCRRGLSEPANLRLQRLDPVVVAGGNVELERPARGSGGWARKPGLGRRISAYLEHPVGEGLGALPDQHGPAGADRNLQRGVGGIELDEGVPGPRRHLRRRFSGSAVHAHEQRASVRHLDRRAGTRIGTGLERYRRQGGVAGRGHPGGQGSGHRARAREVWPERIGDARRRLAAEGGEPGDQENSQAHAQRQRVTAGKQSPRTAEPKAAGAQQGPLQVQGPGLAGGIDHGGRRVHERRHRAV